MRQAVIINYWLKMITLGNTAEKHVILGRMLGIQYLVLTCFLIWYFTLFVIEHINRTLENFSLI